MSACPRDACGGSLVLTWDESAICSLCARTATGPRPPTAEERAHTDRGRESCYTTGLFSNDASEATLKASRVL